MSLELDKARLRKQMFTACGAIPAKQAEASALRVAGHVAGCVEFERAERIGFYAAMEAEVSTRPAFAQAQLAGKQCLFPRCLDQNQLEFAQVDDWEQLQPGRFGILEPAANIPASFFGQNDLVLVPGVAFDLQGGRIGHGGGYYDRAFPIEGPPGPFMMGVAHSVQLLNSVPLGNHDRKMDAVVTEAGIFCRTAGAS